MHECLWEIHLVHTRSEVWKKVRLQALALYGNGGRYGEAATGRGCALKAQ